MADDLVKANNFTTRARAIVPQVLELVQACEGLSGEWFANQWNQGGAQQINDVDLLGENAELTAAQLQALVFTIDTIRSTIDGAHRTNLYIAR